MKEDIKTEFKREYTDEIKKTIVAFANTEGGVLYIGINDDGSVFGIDDTDKTVLQITSALRDTIRPDVISLTKISVESCDKKNIIVVRVQRGTARPYYLSSKGLRPEGVYIRHGASSIPAPEALIVEMIRENAQSFETERSLNQDLSFEQASEYFKRKNVEFGNSQKKSLGLIGKDGTYTVLALLLSDQNPYSIKLAVFDGESKNDFRDRREINSSVLKQVEDAYEFIDKSNRVRSEFSGLERTDRFDYPKEALREALLNCVVHRDYAFSGPILISVFDDRIEFVSIGGLVKGLKKEDIFLGISQPRNPKLANVFYRLRLIEAYGTGILKIKEAYSKTIQKPVFEITDNAFKIVLPNTNVHTKNDMAQTLSSTDMTILNSIEAGKLHTRKEIQDKTRFSQSTVIKALKKLEQNGLIIRKGNARTVVYSKV